MRHFRYGSDPLCVVGCLSYAFNRWVLLPKVDAPFLHSYCNDLWLIPCALPWVLWVQRALRLRRHNLPPTLAEVLGHLAVWSVLAEVIGPRIWPVTADVLDVLAYGLGGIAAWLWWNRPLRPNAGMRV